MPEPTPDTPQERDDKADVLASQFRRFKWEMRVYLLATIGYILLN